jgi:O-antigen/teichoic acid export membrane protein
MTHRAPSRRPGMEFSALALMSATGGTALLGVVFWAVAARLYTPADVGRASALISAATLLANLAQLNLGNVYARFLAGAGGHQRRLVFGGYAAVSVLALVLGLGYTLLGTADLLFVDGGQKLMFPICVALLAVFALQDMILVSVGRAGWVPVENIAFGIAKLVLLAVFAGSLPDSGIWFSWMAPAVVAVAAVSMYLARSAAVAGRDIPPGTLPSRRMLGQTIVGEYVTGLVSTAVPLMLPLLVVSMLGVEANAWFTLPWLVSSSLSLLMWNVASALLVQASSAGEQQRAYLMRRALRLALAVGGAGAITLWFLGPVLLSLLGSAYADNSTWLLRLVSCAAPASAVIVVWTTAARIRHRLGQVVALQLCLGVAIITGAVLLMPALGIVGIGVAYLCVQAAGAAALLVPLLRSTRPTPAETDARAEALAVGRDR